LALDRSRWCHCSDCERRCRRTPRTPAARGGFLCVNGETMVLLPSLRGPIMSTAALLDAAGRSRSPATLPGHHVGRAPGNKGRRYPADPPTVEEIVAVMRQAGTRIDGRRARALIVVLWRAGLRVSEALALSETDLDPRRGSILVRRGKGGKRRTVGMDAWAWEQLTPWLQDRLAFPPGAMFCVIHGPTAGRPCSPPSIRAQFRRLATQAGVRRRFAPHQLRHAHAGHPTSAGSLRPRDHKRVPPRHRQQRNHRHNSRPRRPGHSGQRRTQALATRKEKRRTEV